VKIVFTETLQKSVSRVLCNITNTASVSNVYKMMRLDLNWTSYTSLTRKHLKASVISSRFAVANWMKDRPDIADITWFSDEAYFYSNAQVNK